MSRLVALGERRRLEGLALAGVPVLAAESAEAVREAWSGMDADVAVVILTETARSALADLMDEPGEVIWTSIPD